MTGPGSLPPAAQLLLQLTLDRPLAFFDLETTGTNVNSDRIVEICYVVIHPDGESGDDTMRIDPGVPIPQEASDVHGITDEEVDGCRSFKIVAQRVANDLKGCDLAGFNIRRFDLPLLIEEFKRAGVQFSLEDRRLIDLQTIFFRENPRDLSAAVERYLGRTHDDAHAAQADVEVCVEILAGQIKAHGLPRDSEGLHSYCDETSPFETEVQKWFDMSGRIPVFRRGKHAGKDVAEVGRRWPGYFDWMIGLDDLGSDVKHVAREAIMGGFR